MYSEDSEKSKSRIEIETICRQLIEEEVSPSIVRIDICLQQIERRLSVLGERIRILEEKNHIDTREFINLSRKTSDV